MTGFTGMKALKDEKLPPAWMVWTVDTFMYYNILAICHHYNSHTCIEITKTFMCTLVTTCKQVDWVTSVATIEAFNVLNVIIALGISI